MRFVLTSPTNGELCMSAITNQPKNAINSARLDIWKKNMGVKFLDYLLAI